MDKITISSQNIKYILWKQDKSNREKWVENLVLILDCNKTRAKQLLLNDPPTEEEKEKVAKFMNRLKDDIATELFLDEKVDILKENLVYLFESIEQKSLAKDIGVSKDAVSKWKLGKQKVSKKNLATLREYFRLSSDIDLRNDPIFLSWTPIDEHHRREWLKRQFDEIDSDTLRDLFPALVKLLKD